jgi:alpha-galactosidase
LTLGENRAHFTLWCLAKAPLLLGNDLTNMPKEIFDIVTNQELIAWNQDPLGVQGYMRWSSAIRNGVDPDEEGDADSDTAVEIWAGDLDGGDIAVVLLNRSPESKTVTAQFQDIGISGPGGVHVRDVWKHEDWKEIQHQSLTATVPSHDVVALRLTPDDSSGMKQRLRGADPVVDA